VLIILPVFVLVRSLLVFPSVGGAQEAEQQNTQADIPALWEINAAWNDSHGVSNSSTATAAVANASRFCNSRRGVTCTDVDQQPRGSAIHLPGAELRGYLSEAGGNPGQLQIVSLRRNDASGIISPSLANRSQLRAVYLYQNDFSGPIPTEIVTG
jgi:hypothetical protein